MTKPKAGLELRLYGMMQHLLAAIAHDEGHPSTEPRNVVEKEDVLDAVIQIAAALDEMTQSGVVPTERAMWMASLLMVIRDYIQPLPPGIGDDGVTDRATSDLAEIVTALRAARPA